VLRQIEGLYIGLFSVLVSLLELEHFGFKLLVLPLHVFHLLNSLFV